MRRRQYLSAGVAATALLGLPRLGAARPTTSPPGVLHRHTYETLWATGTAQAHSGGHVLVGRAGPRPDPDDTITVAVLDADGEVRQRTTITPDLPDESHATPDVVRTEDGYAVAAGPWLARFDTDLTLRSTAKNEDVEATKQTTLLPLPDGFVVGFTEWLPNAFWTHLLGFDADGTYRWHYEHNVNGSQSLDFLVPAGDGGALAGGTFPWLAELDADGTFREVPLPEDLPSGVLNAGVRDGEGLVLCSGNTMVRLDASYAVDWTQEYDTLADEQVVEMTATEDGGFLFLTGGVSVADALLCKTGPSGDLRWKHGYTVDSAAETRIQVLTEAAPGEFLVAGGYHLSAEGWALRLSMDQSPTATPSPTDSATPTVSPTPPTHNSPTADQPTTERPNDQSEETTTTAPGFGMVTGGLVLGGTLLLRALRGSREE
jgi:hypothetical protein